MSDLTTQREWRFYVDDNVPQRRIDEICRGERAITADTAVRLGAAFGVDPQFWLNLQSRYDIELVQLTPGLHPIERLVAAWQRKPERPLLLALCANRYTICNVYP